jgi:ergothioneine biosynthesis protein EgtB
MVEPLAERYRAVRAHTDALTDGLLPEDCVVQSMPDASPVKWHLGHTTWFFETFVLSPVLGERHRRFDTTYEFLFNSYYDGVGDRHARPRRGMLTRPSLDDVWRYRGHVNAQMHDLLARPLGDVPALTVEVGLEHEMQHAELIVTDVTHLVAENPTHPRFEAPALVPPAASPRRPSPATWKPFEAGVYSIGHAGPGFAFDNEAPRHRVFLEEFEIADRLVTNGEYAEMIADRGYERPELWLSDGWARVQAEAWSAPLYWSRDDGDWRCVGLDGLRLLDPAAPVSCISHFEADAYARWAGARLPTEAEWEVAAAADALADAFGEVWQWTGSAYLPYPGFRPFVGTLGEYNGKFMSGQMVLRGASRATPRAQHRYTYRNFFPPSARWQFAGLRLARDRR